jgi:AcrR family transcriptional regulator
LTADPTAVYRHFRDKDELVHAVYDRMLSQQLTRIDMAASWKDQVRQAAHLSWDICEEYPSIGIESLNLTTGGPGELAAVEFLLERILQSGLAQNEAVRFYAVVAAYVISVGGALAATRMKANADGSWLGDLAWADPRKYPTIDAARHELAALNNREIVEVGLEMLLDAAEATGHGSDLSNP